MIRFVFWKDNLATLWRMGCRKERQAWEPVRRLLPTVQVTMKLCTQVETTCGNRNKEEKPNFGYQLNVKDEGKDEGKDE